MYFPQYSIIVSPQLGEKRQPPRPPVHVPVPPCVYKRMRRASLKGVGRLSRHTPFRAHALAPSSDIVIRHAQTPLLAKTWELPSLSRPACTPYYKHSGCKIIQCTRTPPLLDVRPRGRNQDNPRVTVLPLASTSRTRKHAAFTSWDPDPRVRTLTVGAPGRESLRDIFPLVPI